MHRNGHRLRKIALSLGRSYNATRIRCTTLGLRRHRHTKEETEAEVITMHRQGLSADAIAKQLNICHGYVRKIKQRHGYKRCSRARHTPQDIADIELQAAERYAAGESAKSICQALRIGDRRLYACVRAHGVPLRNRAWKYWTAPEIENVRQLRRQQKTIPEIAAVMGMPASRVGTAICRYRIARH